MKFLLLILIILFSLFRKRSITREVITKILNLYTSSEHCLKELRKYRVALALELNCPIWSNNNGMDKIIKLYIFGF